MGRRDLRFDGCIRCDLIGVATAFEDKTGILSISNIAGYSAPSSHPAVAIPGQKGDVVKSVS